jgi:hypothetical protein
MNNKIIGAVVVVVIIAGAAFYGGMTYAKSSMPARGGGNFGNGTFMRGTGGPGGMRFTNGGFTTGQILSTDGSSVTIKMQDGSTKIVLIGANTEVMKTVAGSPGDLTAGTNVLVMGTPNSDGSLTASSVQIRPAGTGFGSTTPRQ